MADLIVSIAAVHYERQDGRVTRGCIRLESVIAMFVYCCVGQQQFKISHQVLVRGAPLQLKQTKYTAFFLLSFSTSHILGKNCKVRGNTSSGKYFTQNKCSDIEDYLHVQSVNPVKKTILRRCACSVGEQVTPLAQKDKLCLLSCGQCPLM